MKYVLAVLVALGLGSVAYATDCHQNVQRVQRVVVDNCHQNVQFIQQPYAVVLPVEVLYPHQNFIVEQVNYDYGQVQQVQKQVVRQVERQGLLNRLRGRQQAIKQNRQNSKAKVVVKEQVVVRERVIGGGY